MRVLAGERVHTELAVQHSRSSSRINSRKCNYTNGISSRTSEIPRVLAEIIAWVVAVMLAIAAEILLAATVLA